MGNAIKFLMRGGVEGDLAVLEKRIIKSFRPNLLSTVLTYAGNSSLQATNKLLTSPYHFAYIYQVETVLTTSLPGMHLQSEVFTLACHTLPPKIHLLNEVCTLLITHCHQI